MTTVVTHERKAIAAGVVVGVAMSYHVAFGDLSSFAERMLWIAIAAQCFALAAQPSFFLEMARTNAFPKMRGIAATVHLLSTAALIIAGIAWVYSALQ
jgi:hypothetical protein